MSSTKEIRSRIKSIKNTEKITRAMELISTIKMKKSQDSVRQARPFSKAVSEILEEIGGIHDSLIQGPEKKQDAELVLVISSNRGLCGSYNVNVFKKIVEHASLAPKTSRIDYVSVGKRARDFLIRSGSSVVADFSDVAIDHRSVRESRTISHFLYRAFEQGDYDRITVIHGYFISTLTQGFAIRRLLPLNLADVSQTFGVSVAQTSAKREFLFEPNRESIAREAVPLIFDLMLYTIILEAHASEHSSRTIAMKNAKESAQKRGWELTVSYNKSRQASITKEITEITSGVESMKE